MVGDHCSIILRTSTNDRIEKDEETYNLKKQTGIYIQIMILGKR